MSMTTHIIGFQPPDEVLLKMKAVWDACVAANTRIPDEVQIFFNYAPPDDRGVEVALSEQFGLREWHSDGREGYEIELAKLPANVTHLRFYNSY